MSIHTSDLVPQSNQPG